ncbi:hypothetical protein RFI_09990, partial [Reticulomyxa filosa]
MTCQLNLRSRMNNTKARSGHHHESDNTPTATMSSEPPAEVNMVSSHGSKIGVKDLALSAKLGIMAVAFDSGSCWIIPLSKLSVSKFFLCFLSAVIITNKQTNKQKTIRDWEKKKKKNNKNNIGKKNRIPRERLAVEETSYVSDYENVTCCDLCDRFHLLALGLATGDVVIYQLHVDVVAKSFVLQLFTYFSPAKEGLVPHNFGFVVLFLCTYTPCARTCVHVFDDCFTTDFKLFLFFFFLKLLL